MSVDFLAKWGSDSTQVGERNGHFDHETAISVRAYALGHGDFGISENGR